jgi:hypothetical protein
VSVTDKDETEQLTFTSPRRLPARSPLRAFHALLVALLALLVPQFVLGMFINLYVPFPGTLHGSGAWQWALAQPLIAAHIYLGTLLVLLAVGAVVLGAVAHRAAPLVASLAGGILLLFTWFSGDLFLAEGQQNVRSISMALGFMAALIVYAVAYHVTRERYQPG